MVRPTAPAPSFIPALYDQDKILILSINSNQDNLCCPDTLYKFNQDKILMHSVNFNQDKVLMLITNFNQDKILMLSANLIRTSYLVLILSTNLIRTRS